MKNLKFILSAMLIAFAPPISAANNLSMDGNAIRSINIDGDVNLIPDGVGQVRTSKQLAVGVRAVDSAMFSVTSISQGAICAPVMSTTQRDAISSPAKGLQIFNDTTNALNFYNGSAWSAVGGGGSGTVTSVGTGTGLTGGPVTTTGTISLANTAVSAGSYTNTSLTVDAQGRITAASNGSGSGATSALDNLTTTSINQSLLPDTDLSYNIGDFTSRWATGYFNSIKSANSNANIDVTGRSLNDASGNISVNWNDRSMSDSGGTTTIDWESELLKRSDGTATVKWQETQLNDSTNVRSMIWGNRTLYDTGGTIVALNWETRSAITAENNTVVDWQNGLLSDNSTNTQSMDWYTRVMVDADGGNSLNWNTRLLIDENGDTVMSWHDANTKFINWPASLGGAIEYNISNGSFQDQAGTSVFAINERTLTDDLGQAAFLFTSTERVLYDTAGDRIFGSNGDSKISVQSTITTGGTTGAQTIDKPQGTVNFAGGATSLVVTNNTVATDSIVHAIARTNDATCYVKNVVSGSGSFTINMVAACTGETSVGFLVLNNY